MFGGMRGGLAQVTESVTSPRDDAVGKHVEKTGNAAALKDKNVLAVNDGAAFLMFCDVIHPALMNVLVYI